jgi:hypothetical protein
VRRRIQLLRELESELDRMVAECSGGRVTDCRVLEVLGDHELCRSDHGHETVGATEHPVPDRSERK